MQATQYEFYQTTDKTIISSIVNCMKKYTEQNYKYTHTYIETTRGW